MVVARELRRAEVGNQDSCEPAATGSWFSQKTRGGMGVLSIGILEYWGCG